MTHKFSPFDIKMLRHVQVPEESQADPAYCEILKDLCAMTQERNVAFEQLRVVRGNNDTLRADNRLLIAAHEADLAALMAKSDYWYRRWCWTLAALLATIATAEIVGGLWLWR